MIQRFRRGHRRRGHGGGGGRRGSVETLRAKVISAGDAGYAALDAQGDGLRYDLELRLLLLCPLRHRLENGSLENTNQRDFVQNELAC